VKKENFVLDNLVKHDNIKNTELVFCHHSLLVNKILGEKNEKKYRTRSLLDSLRFHGIC